MCRVTYSGVAGNHNTPNYPWCGTVHNTAVVTRPRGLLERLGVLACGWENGPEAR